MPHEQLFDTAAELAERLAEQVAADLNAALAARGAGSLVVSGGRTPLALFGALQSKQLPWERVWITLADERWVPPDSPDSNERTVREHLLAGRAQAARFVPLKNSAATPEQGVSAAETAVVKMPRPFDTVVLGMGDDGHTASWFPQSQQLAAALDADSAALCAAVHPVTAPHPRMTLTLPALAASRRIVVHISGDAKWRVYQRARQNGPVEELPIRAVLRQTEVPVDVYWSP